MGQIGERPGSYLVNVGFIVWITLSAAALWWVFFVVFVTVANLKI
jgi:hypothetical protein